MSGKEKCCQCMNLFSMLRLPRKLPCCQHSICQPCIRQIIDHKQEIIFCGFCNSVVYKQDIRIFPLNTPLLLTLSENPPKELILPKEDDNELLRDLILSPQATPNSQEICPSHKVVMDIICISDKQKICPHCALFGAHRDHRFKRLDDFDRELKQKKKVFAQIQSDKDKALHNQLGYLTNQLHKRVHKRGLTLRAKIEEQFRRYELELRKRKEVALHQVDSLLLSVEKELKQGGPVEKFDKVREKLESWEKSCLSSLYKLEATKRIEDRLYYYYEGPLEIVTEGYIFIEELNKCRQEALERIDSTLAEITLSLDSGKAWFQRCVLILRKECKEQRKQDDCEINPFMDCTSSEIILGTNSFLNNNTSLEVDIASIPSSSKVEQASIRTPKRRESDIKHLRSVEKERPRIQTQGNVDTPYLKKAATSFLSPKVSKRPISELSSFKSPVKLIKNTSGKGHHSYLNKEIQQSHEEYEVKEPQKIYLQFSKNTLSDFFDISDCGLSSDKVVDYVHRARRIHKIRGLKICNNNLTNAGFERMTEFIQGISNINAANNQLSEGIFQVILKNRDRLVALKILNLTHNPVCLDKNKGAAKLQQVRKMGIIITL